MKWLPAVASLGFVVTFNLSNTICAEQMRLHVSAVDKKTWEPLVCTEAAREAGDCYVTQVVRLRSRFAGNLVHVLYCELSPTFTQERCYPPEQVNRGELFSVADDGGTKKLALPSPSVGDEGIGDYIYAARIKQFRDSEFLITPVRMSGTGNMNTSSYYALKGGQFVPLVATLEQDLQERLPAGMEVWKGIWPDFDTMTFIRPLWKKGDGNCCPSAGVAVGEIEFTDTRLQIRRFRVFRGERAIRRELNKWAAAHATTKKQRTE